MKESATIDAPRRRVYVSAGEECVVNNTERIDYIERCRYDSCKEYPHRQSARMSSMFIYVVVSIESKEWKQEQKVFTDLDKAMAFAKEEFESGYYERVYVRTFESNGDDTYTQTTITRLEC